MFNVLTSHLSACFTHSKRPHANKGLLMFYQFVWSDIKYIVNVELGSQGLCKPCDQANGRFLFCHWSALLLSLRTLQPFKLMTAFCFTLGKPQGWDCMVLKSEGTVIVTCKVWGSIISSRNILKNIYDIPEKIPVLKYYEVLNNV